MTTGHLKRIVDKAKKMGFDDGRAGGYGAGHTRGYKEGFEVGRLFERSPELFGMNYLTYLDEIESNRLARKIDKELMSLPDTDIPQIIREAFNE